MINLGIDASTTTVGLALIDVDNNKILDCCFIDISKKESFKEKVQLIIDEVSNRNYKFDNINMEASLSYCGPLMQKTVILLSRFNAVTEYILNEHYKKKINLINVSTARKKLFSKSKEKGKKPKQFVKENIEKMFDISKFVIKNKKDQEDVRMDDVRDAIVIGFYK